MKAMAPAIQEVKKKHESHILRLPGVVSVGIGMDENGHHVIIIGLDGPRPDTVARLPGDLEGYPVIIRIVGTIHPL